LLGAMNTMAPSIGGRKITVVVVDRPDCVWEGEEEGLGLHSESFGNDADRQLVQSLRERIIGLGWIIGSESNWGPEYSRMAQETPMYTGRRSR
jgi:hypothetical protein